jgi:hypothetical protein
MIVMRIEPIFIPGFMGHIRHSSTKLGASSKQKISIMFASQINPSLWH